MIRTDGPRPLAEPVFLVLEHHTLIADDIMETLKAIGPCRVIHARDPSSISKLLCGEGRISAAFLNMDYANVLEEGIDRELLAHGARIILTVGDEDRAQALARGWGILIRPFTDEMVRDMVVPRPSQ